MVIWSQQVNSPCKHDAGQSSCNSYVLRAVASMMLSDIGGDRLYQFMNAVCTWNLRAGSLDIQDLSMWDMHVEFVYDTGLRVIFSQQTVMRTVPIAVVTLQW